MPEAEVMAPSINADFDSVHTLFLGFPQSSSLLGVPIARIRSATRVGFQVPLLRQLLRRGTTPHSKVRAQVQHFQNQESQKCC